MYGVKAFKIYSKYPATWQHYRVWLKFIIDNGKGVKSQSEIIYPGLQNFVTFQVISDKSWLSWGLNDCKDIRWIGQLAILYAVCTGANTLD